MSQPIISTQQLLTGETVQESKKSSLIPRSVPCCGKRTSVRLEQEMWTSLNLISQAEQLPVGDLISLVSKRKKPEAGLTSSLRVFIVVYFQYKAGFLKQNPLA